MIHLLVLLRCDKLRYGDGVVSVVPGYTDLAMSTVIQRLSIAYTGTVQLLHFYLSQLAGDVTQTNAAGSIVLRVFSSITVTLHSNMVLVEVRNPRLLFVCWHSSSLRFIQCWTRR